MIISLLVAKEKICFGNSSRFIRSVYDNNPQRNISDKTELFQCTAICVDGGTQGGYSCDASQGNFLCTEKIFPVQRKFASAASQSDFVSLPSRRGANVRFSLDIAQTHILFCLDTKKYAKKVKAYATSRPAWCLLAKLRKLAYGSNNSLFSTLTSHSGYPVSLANAD